MVAKVGELPLDVELVPPHAQRVHPKSDEVGYRVGPLGVRQERGAVGDAGVELLRPQLYLGQGERPAQHVGHELPQSRLDESRPGLRVLLRRSDDTQAQVMRISDEEIGRLEELLPNLPALRLVGIQHVPPLKVLVQLVNDVVAPAELLVEYLQCLSAHAQRRVHGRVRGSDHRRHLPHRRRLVGVPHRQSQLGVVGLREHDGIRPPPALEHQEELSQERRGTRVGVQLEHERHGDVDVHSPPVPHLVRVQSPILGPLSNEADHGEEGLVSLFGAAHEGGDEVGDAGSVEALLGGRVHPAQDGVVVDVEVRGDGRGIQSSE
mmetsp:Transcript_50859/g.108360  ORF Transcript_50859/g.108360 Transcript_50859/m.108360 type:complete len:321 (-) Transcript_50859:343-1305(-)